MKFEDSKYSSILNYTKLKLSIGEFYFFDTFFISEIYEGIHLDIKNVEEVLEVLVNFYGENIKLGHVSNRINSFSINPQSWVKIQNEYGIIVATAITFYNNISLMHANIEKHFSKKSTKRCTSLEEAIEWIQNLKEFSNVNNTCPS